MKPIVFVVIIMVTGCTTIQIKEVDCNVNQSWPSCRVVAEEVAG
jgi:hypothetical protein